MTQQTLEFHPAKADFLKEKGMSIAEANSTLLEKAREIALWLGRRGTPVVIDDVISALAVYGHKPSELGNAAGRVFLPSQWNFVGYTKSIRVSNHSRVVRMWVRK